MSVEDRLDRIEKRLDRVDERLDALNGEVSKLIGQSNTVQTLVKYVITPLIILLAALVGIKLVI